MVYTQRCYLEHCSNIQRHNLLAHSGTTLHYNFESIFLPARKKPGKKITERIGRLLMSQMMSFASQTCQESKEYEIYDVPVSVQIVISITCTTPFYDNVPYRLGPRTCFICFVNGVQMASQLSSLQENSKNGILQLCHLDLWYFYQALHHYIILGNANAGFSDSLFPLEAWNWYLQKICSIQLMELTK